MDPIYWASGLLLAGGIAAAGLTTMARTAIQSYTEYKAVTQQLGEAPYQERPHYRSIFWKNLKNVHAVIFGRGESSGL